MEKIKNTNTTMIQKKQNENKRHYTINVIRKGSGFQARTTLKVIKDGKNPRISAYSGISADDAVCKVLNKILIQLSEYKKMNILKKDTCLNIYDSIMISIQELKLTNNPNIMKHATNIFQVLTSINNSNITLITDSQKNITEQTISNNIYQTNKISPSYQEKQDNLIFFEQNQIKPINIKDFKSVAEEWFEYKKSLTIKSTENPKPLSPKTVEGYNKPLVTTIIPYFKKNENISLITEKDLKNCINSVNCFRTKEVLYIILKMIFDFAREQNYIFYIPQIKKPKKPYTDKEESIIFIEADRQDIWLNIFEQENTDSSLLFETMLLTGLRPEEACGLKWCAINESANELIINNAYKDTPIYNRHNDNRT